MEPLGIAEALKGRYDVQQELGRGGMAAVYLAFDRRHNRRVAIKVLHPELAASVGAERFLREIQIAARLVHPNILPLIDSGADAGFLYYVTPHVTGGSLREKLRTAGRMSVADALRVLREVGSALDYAHRQGIVHRDVKPENVLFADGHALLADFGIARACSAVAAETVTERGVILGTPEYMSPEQAAGETVLTGASDAYALACVAYELLAGEPPFRGAGAQATMARQVVEPPRPVRTLRPDAPPHVERALARELAKDPADRFPSVSEFIDALAADAAAGGAARGGAVPNRCIAVLPFVNASPEPDTEYLSDGITDELIDALAKVGGLRVASRSSVFALKGKPQDVRAIGSLLGSAWVLEGTVRRSAQRLRISAQLSSTDDGSLLWSERFDRDWGDVLAIQEEIARTIVATLRTTSFADLATPAPAPRRTRSVEAYRLYLKGRYAWNKRTSAGVAEAIHDFQAAIALDPGYAQAYTGLADAYALQIDYRDIPVTEGFANAETYARRALAIDDTVAEAHASLAWTLFIYKWDWAESRHEFARAIELDPGYATAHQWYAFWLCVHGRMSEAIAEVERAVVLDPASVSIRRTVGWAYYYARRYEEALRLLERAVAMNPTADETLRVRALTEAALGQWDDAERSIREAVALSHGGTYNRATRAYLLARTGRTGEARSELAALEAIAREGYVSPVAFATVYLGLEEWERALDWVERAFEERRGWMAYLRVNPIVDPLRGRARFAALLERMKL